MNTQEMVEKRAALISDARSIIDAADAEGRELNGEQREKVDSMLNDADVMQSDIEQRQRLDKYNEQLAKVEERKTTLAIDSGDKEERDRDLLGTPEYRDAFVSYLRRGSNGLTSGEIRALEAGTDSEGGYATETTVQRMIVETLDDESQMRKLATVIATESDRNVPVESSATVAAWTGEEDALGGTDPVFAQASLSAYKAAVIVKISNELLFDSVFDMSSYLGRNIGRGLANLEETAFVNGTGSSQPTGVTDGSSAGTTAASATAVTADEIIEHYYTLGQGYRRNATWMFNSTVAGEIRKLKDGDNRYVWQPSLAMGAPDTILGRPVVISEDCEAMTTGLKPILFGDFSYYWIADRGSVVLQRLNELYAANDQVGFKACRRTDGVLTTSAAVKHLLMA
jgi:HK97 family phage major capsid protein